jgi:hypothetical protein
MSTRNRVVCAAVAIGALGVAGPVTAASAGSGAGPRTAAPVVCAPTAVAPWLANAPGAATASNPVQAGNLAALGGATAGAIGAASGGLAWQTAQAGNPYLAGAEAALGGFLAGSTAAQTGIAAGAVALGTPMTCSGL